MSRREDAQLIKVIWRRLSVVALETMIAMFVVYSAAAGLLHIPGIQADVLADVLGGYLVTAFQVVYLVAGLAMLYGIAGGRRRARFEEFGIILVITSIIVRQVALVAVALDEFGWAAIGNTIVFNSLAVFWLGVRLFQLLRGYSIARFKVVSEDGLHAEIEL